MPYAERLSALEGLLVEHRDLWHPQPFREPRPSWQERWPVLAEEVLALPEDAVEPYNDDGAAARALLARHCSQMAGIEDLLALPEPSLNLNFENGACWAWGIPGRKRCQIEAFVAASQSTGCQALEWCAGKGHLGRLFTLRHGVQVCSLEIDAGLCAAGGELARRAAVTQEFLTADALNTVVPKGCHALSLHACGELHRALLRQAANCVALDVVPCCYHHGVAAAYVPMSEMAGQRAALYLTHDDVRLAVTETVTASRRQTLQRQRDMAWKLAFDGLRRLQGVSAYVSFKPVPPDWLRGDFASFCRQLAKREGIELASSVRFSDLEALGWHRQREVMRYSIVRHAFRRPLELWLVLDMAVFLEEQGWQVTLSVFCSRQCTPRNLLISARRK